MIIAHPFAGVCTTSLVASKWKNLSDKQQSIIWTAGITASILPDLDLALTFFIPDRSHHLFITHTPFFYLLIGLVLALTLLYLERVKNLDVEFKEKVLIIILANIIFHVLLDTIAGNMLLLWPVDTTTYTVFQIPSTDWLSHYINSPACLFEIGMIICGIIALFLLRKRKYFKNILKIFSFWFVIGIIMTFVFVL